MADLQHRKETDDSSYLLPAGYYEAIDVTAKGDSLGFEYHVRVNQENHSGYMCVSYHANKVGKYEATVKQRDGNKAKGKFTFNIR